MNGQIVCCKGVNDGDELREEEVLRICQGYLPFMQVCQPVPAGITKYRYISIGVIYQRRGGSGY